MTCELYPEGSARILREAIGEVYGLDPARIVAAAKVPDALLTMLAAAYLRPGRRGAVQPSTPSCSTRSPPWPTAPCR